MNETCFDPLNDGSSLDKALATQDASFNIASELGGETWGIVSALEDSETIITKASNCWLGEVAVEVRLDGDHGVNGVTNGD